MKCPYSTAHIYINTAFHFFVYDVLKISTEISFQSPHLQPLSFPQLVMHPSSETNLFHKDVLAISRALAKQKKRLREIGSAPELNDGELSASAWVYFLCLASEHIENVGKFRVLCDLNMSSSNMTSMENSHSECPDLPMKKRKREHVMSPKPSALPTNHKVVSAQVLANGNVCYAEPNRKSMITPTSPRRVMPAIKEGIRQPLRERQRNATSDIEKARPCVTASSDKEDAKPCCSISKVETIASKGKIEEGSSSRVGNEWCSRSPPTQSGISKKRKMTSLNATDEAMAKAKFKCIPCKRTYKWNGDYMRHFNFHHLRQRPFQCDECDKSFGRTFVLNKHKMNIHGSNENYRGT